MIVIASKGRVPAPLEQVWSVVRRPEALPTWLAGLRQVRFDGPEGFDRRLWFTGSRVDDEPDQQAEIIAWKPPTLLAWRCLGDRDGGDELHLQLTPLVDGTQVRLYAVRPAGLLEGLRLRLGPAWRWRAELARSLTALAGLFPASSPPH